MYALKHKASNKIVNFYTIENDKRDNCVSKSYYLSLEDNLEPWTTLERETAESVINNPKVNWARATIYNPCHTYSPEELEIVQL